MLTVKNRLREGKAPGAENAARDVTGFAGKDGARGKNISGKERFRHEWKYRISDEEHDLMRFRMAPAIRLDRNAKNGGYLIRSLYFDDYRNSAYEEKDAGVLMRKKYRIRIYNYSSKTIHLERKKKFGSYIYKESAPLKKEEFYRILEGDYGFLLTSPHPLLREFYAECVTNVLRPRCIVDYEREPWVMDEGTVRITFDMNVRAAVGGFDIFDRTLPTLPVMEPGELILEVKYTEFLPQLVRNLIPPKSQEQTAFSKYVLCYDRTAYLRGFEYFNAGE